MAVITNNISGSSSGGSRIGITGSVIISNTSAPFPQPSSDTVFFVSGSENAKSVFGGAAKISGSLITDGNVQIGDSSNDTLTINASTVSIPNNLNFDSNTLYIDSTNDRIGIGKVPSVTLDVSGSLTSNGADFTGVTKHNQGLSGSLTKLTDGTSYLIAGSNITITSASNGAVTISGQAGDITAVTAGTGLIGGGSSGDVILNINDSVVATISGSTFTGDIAVNGGDLTSTSATFNLLDSGQTTLNVGRSASNINIGNVASGNTITIGSQTGASSLNLYAGSTPGAINIESGTGAIYIGNTASARTVQLGTGAAVQNVFIGSILGASTTSIRGGTSVILSGSAGTIYTIGGTDTTGTITLGQSTASNIINIGSATLASSQTQGINIGAPTLTGGNSVIAIGSIQNASSTAIRGGTSIVLSGSAATTYTIGAADTTGTITLGQSTASNTINIGAAVTASGNTQTINLGTNATGTGKATVTIGNTNGISSIVLNTGAGSTLTLGGSLSTGSVGGSLEVTGNSVFGTVIESMLNNNNSSGVTAFSLANQSIFYVNNPAGNVTANFTNAQTTNNRIISTTVILSQSTTARIVSAVQIDGVASTINWANNVTPTGNSGKQDIFGFNLIRSGSAWKTLGQMTTYG